MEFNYSIAARVYSELDSLDFKSSKDKLDTAVILCKKNDIPLSNLFIYDDWLQRQRQEPINIPIDKVPKANLLFW